MAGGSGDKEIDLQQMLICQDGIKTTVTTVGTAAVITLVASPFAKRARVYVVNTSSISVFIGNGSVTASNGFPLLTNAPIPLPVSDGLQVYAIALNGITTIRILELS